MQSSNRAIGQSIHRSMNQSINQSIDQSIDIKGRLPNLHAWRTSQLGARRCMLHGPAGLNIQTKAQCSILAAVPGLHNHESVQCVRACIHACICVCVGGRSPSCWHACMQSGCAHLQCNVGGELEVVGLLGAGQHALERVLEDGVGKGVRLHDQPARHVHRILHLRQSHLQHTPPRN